MADLLSSEEPLKKRKIEVCSPHLGDSCRQVSVSLLNSTELLLQIPPSTNTSLPMWERVRANQVEVMWSVAPYSITVQITPLTSQKAQNKVLPATQHSTVPETQPLTAPLPATQPSTLPVSASLPLPSIQYLPQTIPGVTLYQRTRRAQNIPHPYRFIPHLLLPFQTRTPRLTQYLNTTQAQYLPQLQPLPKFQPLPQVQTLSQTQPLPQTQPLLQFQPIRQAQPLPKTRALFQFQPIPQAQPFLQLQPLPKVQTLSQTQPLPQTQPLLQFQPIPQAQPLPKTRALFQFQPIPQAQPFLQLQPLPKVQTLSQTQPLPQTQPLLQFQPIPQAQPLPKTQALLQFQPIPQAQPFPQFQPLPQTQPLPQPQSFPQLQPLPQTQPHPQPQPFPQLQPRPSRQGRIGGTDLPSMLFQLAAKNFYTKSSRDTHICDSFLIGCCQFKFTCELHHTPYPFHWQLRCRDTHHWVNASLSAQVKLEKLYCDIDRETIRLQDMTNMFTLHLDTMKVESSETYDKARRLTNSSNPGSNPYFPTEWNLYWWNDSSWVKYENEVSKELLAEMEAGETSSWFYFGKQLYEVDFSSLTQMNLTTGFKSRVRRRPTFRSPSSLKSHLKTVVFSEAARPSIQVLPSLSVDPLLEFSSWYPPVWTLSPDQGFSLVKVPPSTKAYQSIHSLFHSTMPETKLEIVSIEQVQNIFQWDKYQRQKEHMQSRSTGQSGSLEQHLFHGTTENSAKEICWNNFDPRVSGKNGVAYGRGSYFARYASYSLKYAPASGEGGCKHMFLAKVLVGNVIVGNFSYCRPPQLNPLKPGYELYDTCVNRMPNPSIFVVFDSCQCYPYYLIKYKVVPDIVNICE